MFDPYEKWLGIPKDQRPLDYFQLLGIDPKEKDAETIRAAAKKRIALVSRHKDGSHAKACAHLLKAIQRAQITLLSPDKRKAYEAHLRRQASIKANAAPKVEELEEVEEVVEVEPAEEEANGPARRADGKRSKKKRDKSSKKPTSRHTSPWLWIGLAAGSVAALVLVVGTVVLWRMRSKTTDEPAPSQPVAAATQPEPAQPPPEPPRQPEPAPPPPPAAKKEPAPAPASARPTLSRPKVRKPRPQVVKLPAPGQTDLDKAAQEIRNTYKDDYAKKKPEDQLALAAKLLQPGRENRANPAAWFALLREAHDAALRAERPRLAVEAIQEMDKWFLIDAFGMKLQTLNALIRDGSEEVARAVVKSALFQADEAVAIDNYDAALRLIDTAMNAARKGKLDKQLAAIETKRHEVQDFQQGYQQVASARERLKQTPDEPNANRIVGRHICLFQNRWDDGLPLLAKGGKDEEAEMARQDLTPPPDIKTQIAVGDGWWQRAEKQTGREKRSLQERAVAWYELAQPVAEETEKVRLMKRMEEAMKEQPVLTRLLPGSFYGRSTEDRILLLREGGGTMQSEDAVERGLQWLALHQTASGLWSNHDFRKIKKCNCTEPGQHFDVAGTAFGLLPFLGAGHTPSRGRYAPLVRKGLGYLLQQQKSEGKFSDNMYENALATIAVCEAYGITRDNRYRLPALAAVQFIVQAQHPEGSWGYSPGTQGDTSVTGWQFSALKAGHYAGLIVPPSSFARVGSFLNHVADPGGLGYGYKDPGAPRATTATGLLCREYLGWWPSHPSLVKAMDPLLKPENFVTKEKPSIYYLFYATQVMHHAGGEAWETWNPKVRDLLIEMQDPGKEAGKEHQKGSWSPRGDEYAAQGGRLMFTSLALLLLEVYYYNIPLHGFGAAVLQD
ncbi:MAG TPA: prenyltransferase/squalene oxidase repeat-containing protein [Gemmataceae bacterium]|nr:prenyltransferase/squalene oxidase repeat-containing protein [Gemmataceae bacterium]